MFTDAHPWPRRGVPTAGPERAAAGWLGGLEARRRPDGAGPADRPLTAPIWPVLEGWPPGDAAAAEGAPERPDAPESPPPSPPPSLTFTEAEVARLCAAAAAEAAAAEAARLADLQAERRLAADARLASALSTVADALRARRRELQAGAVAVGAALGRLLAHEATLRDPAGAAAAVAAELLARRHPDDEPVEVTVEVPEGQAEELAARLGDLARDADLPGRLRVREAAALRPGEVRVLWRDGWAERLLADIGARADAALAALAAGRGPGRLPAVDTVTIAERNAA